MKDSTIASQSESSRSNYSSYSSHHRTEEHDLKDQERYSAPSMQYVIKSAASGSSRTTSKPKRNSTNNAAEQNHAAAVNSMQQLISNSSEARTNYAAANIPKVRDNNYRHEGSDGSSIVKRQEMKQTQNMVISSAGGNLKHDMIHETLRISTDEML